MSCADIVIASMLQLVMALPDDRIPLKDEIRESFFTSPDIAETCQDLLAWRDSIVQKHFPEDGLVSTP